jgi:AraC-like DNA-binding protein
MPSSAVRAFSDPDDYATSIRGSNVETTITSRGAFAAKIVTVIFRRLWVQGCSTNLPRVTHCSAVSDRAKITFRTKPGPSMLRNGVEMGPSNVIRRGLDESYHRRSEGAAVYGAMSLPIEDMVSIGEAMVGCDLTPPTTDALSVTPPASAMARLQHLQAATEHLAEYAPTVIAVPEAARGLEQALIEAMVACLGPGEVTEDRAALRQHTMIMRRFRRAVEEKPDQALFIPELCKAIAVSERTLRICCQEQLGVSPKQYLLLRRMHLVRRSLRESAPTATTVTEIATRYGFWQFGRFAGEYKSLFGELPSATLACPHN